MQCGIRNTEWVSNHMIRNAIQNTEDGLQFHAYTFTGFFSTRIQYGIHNAEVTSKCGTRLFTPHHQTPVAEYGAGGANTIRSVSRIAQLCNNCTTCLSGFKHKCDFISITITFACASQVSMDLNSGRRPTSKSDETCDANMIVIEALRDVKIPTLL